ncbi:unnamed protein product (macronuclear) [Paramecium tetraurelia]|uniref:Growth arrest-specific protein 8 domain-containing protein n=1 Tax=Paramecium tetraurelia TaxID=5888 RepID=A0BT34_PARTE|nr:uncharacterized protein GSPATT00031933001 [Paramecium tetraurelia]CAK61701.1 unnamed protein product [Paramecium tetraurelia]|eukprot:XP_001429099.1 hypothetical protein (macronuclear) [Paramecium tetraurelia strain d4-2]
MSKNKPKPTDAKPQLSKAELEAQNKAKQVNDVENEAYKKQMREEIRLLKTDIDAEEKLLSQYQQEREKINYNWIIAKKELDDKKSDFINKEREIQDLKENHFMQLNLYKQKIKHLLFQNQDQQSDLRKDVEVTLKQLEDDHRMKDRELKTDIRSLKVQQKEADLAQNDYMFALKTEYDRQATQLRQNFERQANDLKEKYHLKMEKLRREMEEARNNLIKILQEKKDLRIQQLTKEHSKKYTEIKNYYSDITATNLDMIKSLKNEITDHQKKEEKDKKLLQSIENESKNLNEPLKAIKEEIKFLIKEKEEQAQVVQQKEQLKLKIDELEKKFRNLEYEYEVKLQHFQYMEREKRSLEDKFNSTIQSIQQKTGLQNLILEKKTSAVQEELEIKELQLNQVLQGANIDQNSINIITRQYQEIDVQKSAQIAELQQQLTQIRKAHSHMVKAYDGKLAEFVIPVEELGFDPLVPTFTE